MKSRLCAMFLVCWVLLPCAPVHGQAKTVDLEAEFKKIRSAKQARKAEFMKQKKVIENVILDQQKLDPDKATKLESVNTARNAAGELLLDLDVKVAEGFARLRSAKSPRQKQELKKPLIEQLNRLVQHQKGKEQLDEFVRGEVPSIPSGRDVTPRQGLPPPPRNHEIRRLEFFPTTDALDQARKINGILKEFGSVNVARDTAPGSPVGTPAERLLNEINKVNDGGGSRTDQGLRRARGEEQRLMNLFGNHQSVILEHNSREPPYREFPTQAEADQWNQTVIYPYNREAEQLNAEKARLEGQLSDVRRRITELRRQR